MSKKKFSVVLSVNAGYSTYQVKATDRSEAEKSALKTHMATNPDEPKNEISVVVVITDWPKTW
ncbi:hypothetical protein Entas_2713 [Enterobacter soli]|uniref:hypothetical protein n=1 Tax=Enterobacter soli TaxID=885040 RepID=UPI000223C9A5|nr:hypothetical protein [Enterobacter soli]AEN65440.1 hypothetical protein Entas_2713 [Enterobacter soli]OAT35839.1 hypothetical protein M987_03904 [Enterobacter soli ATCC BAA-2102]